MLINAKNISFLIFFLSGLLFFSIQIGRPNRVYWDELVHVNGARTLLYGKKPYSAPEHPPLGREILATSLFLFGDTPSGARGLSVVAGAGIIALVFLISFQLTQNLFIGAFSAAALLSDPLFYLHSRIGMLEIFVTFFMALSFWLFLKIQTTPAGERSAASYYLLGALLGIALAVKLVAASLYPIFFTALVWPYLKKKELKNRKAQILHLILGFSIPTLFFFWLPYALMGFSFSEMKEHLSWFWDFQRSIDPHGEIVSHWWEWMIGEKPIWYLKTPYDSAHTSAVLAMGNLLFWIGAEIAFFVLLLNGRRLPKNIFFIHAVIAAQFALWTFKPFPALYYMVPVLPFYALLLGGLLKLLLDRFEEKKKFIQVDAIVYLVLCFVVFGYSFPYFSGKPVPNAKFDQRVLP